jgi:uncharacterized protein (TIGR02301 family)
MSAMRTLAAPLAFLLLVSPLAAQQQRQQPQQPAPQQQQPPQGQPEQQADPPYQRRLERLAEVMGALNHLRPLCQPAEAQSWRRQVAQLIEAEQPSDARRDRIIAAFNRGFSGVAETHRGCTPAARIAADRYRDEAISLSREIATRYAD